MARQDTNRIALKIERDTASNYPQSLNKREKKLAEAILYDGNVDDSFQQALVASNTTQTGIAYTGAAAQVVGLNSGIAQYEVYQAAVATAAIVLPFQSSDGLELKPVAAADALELTLGTTSLSRAALTVGSFKSPRAFMQIKMKIDDISDVTEMFIGFRKAEAYQADPDDYDEMAAIHLGATDDGRISLATILNNAATSMTDTTLTDWADTNEKTLRIEVSNDGKCLFFVDAATPTVTAPFTFDSGEVIVPFIHLNTETGDPGCSISQLQVGYI